MRSPFDPAALVSELTACREAVEPFPEGRFHGDGIVICAGGASIFTNAYVLVHVLRTVLGCALPIEVWHIGTDEMSARMRFLLLELSAEPVDADAAMAAQGVRVNDGWQLKSFALAYSSFARVLLLDADIVPERDPTELFGWPEFNEVGAILWPDICSIKAESQIWKACGLEARTTRAIESGQVLIDKSRNWTALQIIIFLNVHSECYYRMVYGDKDLFLMGFLITNQSFRIIPHIPLTDLGCLFQTDFTGKRLFQHRTNAKWRYRDPQVVVDTFRHLDACKEALEVLRVKWNGRVFNAPPRTQTALAEEERLSSIGAIVLREPGESPIIVDLLEAGEIGNNTAGLSNWYCIGNEPTLLILCDRSERATTFKPNGPGCWVETSTGIVSTITEGRGSSCFNRTAPDKHWDTIRLNYRFDGEP